MKAAPQVLAALCAAALWIWLSAAPAPSMKSLDSATSDRLLNHAITVEQLIIDIEQLRRLKFLRPLKIVYISSNHLKDKIRQDFARIFPPAQAEARQRAALAMGLTREPFDWIGSLTGIATEIPACHYENATATLFVDDSLNLKDHGEVQQRIVFEIARALISQHADPVKVNPWDPMNDDVTLAGQMVIQGEAALLVARYNIAKMSWTAAMPRPPSTTVYHEAPPYLRSRVQFPTSMTPRFQEVLLDEASTAAARDAVLAHILARPPRSSAEVMHLDLYQNEATPPPIRVVIPTQKIKELKLIFDNVMGEFGTLQVLKAYLTQDVSIAAAMGWRGDRYQLFTDPEETGDVVVWQTEWATNEDAQAFLNAAKELLLARFSLLEKSKYNTANGGLAVDEVACVIRCSSGRAPRSVLILISDHPIVAGRLCAAFFP